MSRKSSRRISRILGFNNDGLSSDFSVDISFDGEVQPNERDTKLAFTETRAVGFLRILMMFILVASAAMVSAFVYRYTRRVEEQKFTETFDGYTQQISKTVHVNLQNKLEAVGALALQIQSYAISMNRTWPFVTIPLFEETFIASRSLIGGIGVMLFPVVSAENKEAWETYSIDNRNWVNDSYAAQRYTYGIDQLQAKTGQLTEDVDWFNVLWGPRYAEDDNPDFSYGIAQSIFKTRHTATTDKNPRIDDTEGPFFPQWQSAPMSWYYQTTVNLNYGHYADFRKQIAIVEQTGNAVFGEPWTDPNTPGFVVTLLYPVLNQVRFENATVVAYLGVDIDWAKFLEGILPPSNDMIYVVISNSCEQVFTYKLVGDKVVFLSEDDSHDRRYDAWEDSFVFGELVMEPISIQTYKGRPLYGDYCPFEYRIFPSRQMEENYVSSRPIYYSFVACAIFLFTSIIFLTYDCWVERRQKVVMTSATKANAVVSSLFPATIKERLYEGHDVKKDNAILNKGLDDVKQSMQQTESGCQGDVSPIAELYPETTIMFADLVGFTSWSSERQPSDVFLLLETIYGRFDAIAKQCGVFKVETVGDCYVAATGMPRPQEKHALIMTNFAWKCKRAIRQELTALAETLGIETLNLAVRVGLHSGPVIAGVLRGDKARFQLFGDTMNTASRMESNGMPNRIHVSESTARLLQAAGKGSWLKPRDELIVAKGKGEMQTYWVALREDTRISETSDAFCDLETPDEHNKESFKELSEKLHKRLVPGIVMPTGEN